MEYPFHSDLRTVPSVPEAEGTKFPLSWGMAKGLEHPLPFLLLLFSPILQSPFSWAGETAPPHPLVQQFDLNKNGFLDPGEEAAFRAFLEAPSPKTQHGDGTAPQNEDQARKMAMALKGNPSGESRWEGEVEKFKAHFPEQAQKADGNKDGKISPDELKALASQKPHPEKIQPKAPKAPSPEIKAQALAETLAQVPEWLTALDQNRDGQLSLKELDGKAIGELQKSASKPGPVRDRLLFLKMAASNPDRAREADENRDGRLSEQEFIASYAKAMAQQKAKEREIVKEMDLNGDGQVSQTEKRAAAVKNLKARAGGAIPGLGDEGSLEREREKIRAFFSAKKFLVKEKEAKEEEKKTP